MQFFCSLRLSVLKPARRVNVATRSKRSGCRGTKTSNKSGNFECIKLRASRMISSSPSCVLAATHTGRSVFHITRIAFDCSNKLGGKVISYLRLPITCTSVISTPRLRKLFWSCCPCAAIKCRLFKTVFVNFGKYA